MTQKEKNLLLKDLCTRLPYGVMVKHRNRNTPVKCDLDCHPSINDLENIKSYLRPMSSMTEEEKEYIKNRWCYSDWDIDGASSLWREKIGVEDAEGIIDYFNEHQFDYRGLIPMGLALEAPEGMYK